MNTCVSLTHLMNLTLFNLSLATDGVIYMDNTLMKLLSCNILLVIDFILFVCCRGISSAISVTQQMTEMSLSCEEKAASGSKVELAEPGGYQNWICYLYLGYLQLVNIKMYAVRWSQFGLFHAIIVSYLSWTALRGYGFHEQCYFVIWLDIKYIRSANRH